MPALIAVITGKSGPLRRELADVERAFQAAGFAGAKSMAGVKSGAMREVMVLLREISRGNWSRVPGSFSILVSQLNLMRFLLNPVTIGLVALGAAAFFVVKHFLLLGREAKNLRELMDLANIKFSDQAAVMKHAAEEAQGFRDWLKKVGEAEEGLAERTAETLKKMKEKAKFEKEIAEQKHKSKKDIAKMDIAEAEAELKVLEMAKRTAAERVALDKRVATLAEQTANSPKRAAQLKQAGEAAAAAAKIVDAIQNEMKDKFINEIDVAASRAAATVGGGGTIYRRRAANETDIFHVKVGEKEYGMSLREAKTRAFELARAEMGLARNQKALADNLDKQKHRTEKDAADEIRLKKEARELSADIALKKKYLPMLAEGSGKMMHGTLTDFQKQGAYVANASLVDVSKKIHHEIKGLRSDLKGASGVRKGKF